MTGIELLPANRHARMRWANGGGWTTEIVAEPSSGQWEWRLSAADVDAAGPFSSFPGVDRTIALLRGDGFALTVGDSAEQIIDTPFRPFEFAGDETTTCRLLGGPVQDINLMVRRGSTPRRLEFVELAASSTIELPDVDVLVVLAGTVRVAGHELGYLDAFRCPAGARPLVMMSPSGATVVTSTTTLAHG